MLLWFDFNVNESILTHCYLTSTTYAEVTEKQFSSDCTNTFA